MIVMMNGRPGCGKTTFEEIVQKIVGKDRCYIVSTIDFVKDIARECGWNGEKTPINRKFLSDLKDLLTQWDDVPYKKVCEKIESIEKEFKGYGTDPEKYLLFFVDCREPKEIERFCKEKNATSVIVRRFVTYEEGELSNHADLEVYNYNYDYELLNTGTKNDLVGKALDFLKEIKFDAPSYLWRHKIIQYKIDDTFEIQ